MEEKLHPVAVRPVNDIVDYEMMFLNVKTFLSQFFFEYGALLIFSILFFGVIYWIVKNFSARQKQIEKLWVFILFFLTKRQMMIPLVITLSKKDEILDEDVQNKLLSIRDECRDISLKKNPKTRLKKEEQISKILFYYFSQLEKQEKIKKGSKFEKTVKDLEFIDAKLIELQSLYNTEVSGWNNVMNMPVIKYFFRIFGLKSLQEFQ